MTSQVVPLLPVASQALSISLGGQPVQLRVYARTFGVYVDVLVNDALIIGGVVARNLNALVRSEYLGFFGDLFFVDMVGREDPKVDGLGSRFVLVYGDL
jgi:hypothetical protein